MNCPYCNVELTFSDIHNGNITMQLYYCDECKKLFRRHFIKNKIGLIQVDCLHEVDKEGRITKTWS